MAASTTLTLVNTIITTTTNITISSTILIITITIGTTSYWFVLFLQGMKEVGNPISNQQIMTFLTYRHLCDKETGLID